MTDTLNVYKDGARYLVALDAITKEELEDSTLTLADWIKRKRIADEMVQIVRAVTFEAECQLGKKLKELGL